MSGAGVPVLELAGLVPFYWPDINTSAFSRVDASSFVLCPDSSAVLMSPGPDWLCGRITKPAMILTLPYEFFQHTDVKQNVMILTYCPKVHFEPLDDQCLSLRRTTASESSLAASCS
jgi:hypothetical protein